MKQRTLVAFYEEKNHLLSDLIHLLWQELEASALKDYFIPYALDQIHTTFIGLEKIPNFPVPFNLNIWEKEGKKQQMVFSGLKTTLEDFFPINVQFGGFDKKYATVKSFGKTLFERSFQIQWSTGRVVLIGWPIDQNQDVVMDLFGLRQAMYLRHNILHKYHDDNDCYLVLGILKIQEDLGKISALKKAGAELEDKVQQWLSRNRTTIPIALEDLSIVEYLDPSLELSSSKVWSVGSFR